MNKQEVLNRYFPKVKAFQDVQEPTIDSLVSGDNVLCLMPTGGGKSLIYQVAGLLIGKTTIVVSPLVALMDQQSKQLNRAGLQSVNFSGMDPRKQFNTITDMATGVLPRFIFVSPERISSDGYLEYMLRLRKDDIGLVVVDEVHCVSQWGEGFRPAYRTIPISLDRVFGSNWPQILCLTATLNNNQQEQIYREFRINRIIKGENLWRENLHMEIINLRDGKDETKDSEMERIIEQHLGEKILVFVHRKYGTKGGTTRTLYEKYKDIYEGVDFFDSDRSDSDKERVINGFTDGSIKIVFATSAFGMGIDIEDIRVVINYLISETVEQYYQEVGRAGRDHNPAYGYLLYTNQSKRGRKKLLEMSLCTKSDITDEWENRKIEHGDICKSVVYETMTEEQKTAFSLLLDYGVFSISTKGLTSVRCFEGASTEGKSYLNGLSQYSKTGLIKVISKKSGKSIPEIMDSIWAHCVNRDLKMVKSPDKAMWYVQNRELDESLIEQIIKDQDAKKESRVSAFETFVRDIEAGKTAEQLIKNALDI